MNDKVIPDGCLKALTLLKPWVWPWGDNCQWMLRFILPDFRGSGAQSSLLWPTVIPGCLQPLGSFRADKEIQILSWIGPGGLFLPKSRAWSRWYRAFVTVYSPCLPRPAVGHHRLRRWKWSTCRCFAFLRSLWESAPGKINFTFESLRFEN